jgi:transposase
MEEGNIIWVGLDAHKKAINAAIFTPQGLQELVVTNEPKAVRRFARKLLRLADGREVRCCYEAGPCGFVLKRQLEAVEPVLCEVIAPSLIPSKPGDRVKTDRRDARKLAELLRAGLLTEVQPPTEAQESVRDAMRCREDLKQDQQRARQQLGKWLLRRGFRYTAGRKAWTQTHRRWLTTLQLEHPADRITLDSYLERLDSLGRLLRSIEEQIEIISVSEEYRVPSGRLRCFYGIDTITAMTILTELHDIKRFESPRKLMSYVGVVPSEHSSSDKVRRGGITRTGNPHLRRALIETAWHYRHKPSVGKTLTERRSGQEPRVIALADKAHHRLNRRFNRLLYSGKPSTKAVVAVARELTGFIWAALREAA